MGLFGPKIEFQGKFNVQTYTVQALVDGVLRTVTYDFNENALYTVQGKGENAKKELLSKDPKHIGAFADTILKCTGFRPDEQLPTEQQVNTLEDIWGFKHLPVGQKHVIGSEINYRGNTYVLTEQGIMQKGYFGRLSPSSDADVKFFYEQFYQQDVSQVVAKPSYKRAPQQAPEQPKPTKKVAKKKAASARPSSFTTSMTEENGIRICELYHQGKSISKYIIGKDTKDPKQTAICDYSTGQPAMLTEEKKTLVLNAFGSLEQKVAAPAQPPVAPAPKAPVAPPVKPAVAKKSETPPVAPPALPQAPPDAPPKAPVDYKAKYLQSQEEVKKVKADLAGKTAKVDTLEQRLKERPSTGITQADLDAGVAHNKQEVEQRITRAYDVFEDIVSGEGYKLSKSKGLKLRVALTGGKEAWVYQKGDGTFAYFDATVKKEVPFSPYASEEFNRRYELAKALRWEMAKAQSDVEEAKKTAELEDRIKDLPERGPNNLRMLGQAAAGTFVTALTGIFGHFVEKTHFIETTIRDYLPSANLLADYASQLHQVDTNNYTGMILGALLGLGIAYKVAQSGKAPEQKLVVAQAPVVKPVPPAEMPKPEDPKPAEPKPSTGIRKGTVVMDAEFE